MRGALAVALAAIFLTTAPSVGQNAIELRGRVVHVDGISTAELPVRLVGFGSATTNGSGIFTTAIPSGTSEVQVELIDSDWVVLYPRDGRVPVPREPSTIPEVIVGRSLESTALQLFAERHERLAAGLASVGAGQQEIREVLDSFVGEVTALLDVEAGDFEREIELQRRRLEHFPELSATVRSYVLEARDLSRFFELHGRTAFVDEAVYNGLYSAVQRYNAAFQKLSNERPAFEYQVANYWESEEIRSDLRALYDYLLGEVHAVHILPLNESLRTMYQSLYEQRDRRRNEAAQLTIDEAVRQLNLRLPELERRADRVLAFLSRQ